MARGKKRRDPIPKNFKSLEEFQEFWDTHSTADYDDLMHDVEFKVNLKRRIVLVALEPKEEANNKNANQTRAYKRIRQD